MGARRFLNLLYGALTERLNEEGRDELDAALVDEDTSTQMRMDAILLAGGEIGAP